VSVRLAGAGRLGHAAAAEPLAGALYTRVESPVGTLFLAGDEPSLWALWMEGQRWGPQIGRDWRTAAEPFAEAARQLGQYFAGERAGFELPLRMHGSEFRRRVWEALRGIPFGQTRSYGELARSVGRPSAARAVGLANGRNPFAIILPCHRVVGATGALVGYGGGLERKRWLLAHERRSAVSP
jgi:methylated-DNA-[protein]-cysteine S-methyltransferase